MVTTKASKGSILRKEVFKQDRKNDKRNIEDNYKLSQIISSNSLFQKKKIISNKTFVGLQQSQQLLHTDSTRPTGLNHRANNIFNFILHFILLILNIMYQSRNLAQKIKKNRSNLISGLVSVSCFSINKI